MLRPEQFFYQGFPVSHLCLSVMDADVDPLGRLHLGRMLQYMQEVAAQNLWALADMYEDIHSLSCVWLMQALSMRLKRLPMNREPLSYLSYPGRRQALFLFREFSFSVGEEWLGGASSSWFVADAETHRPLRPDPYIKRERGEGVMDLPIGRLAPRFKASGRLPAFLARTERRAEYSEMDRNGHMNNAHYLNWCLDFLYEFARVERPVLGFDLNFFSELYPGDSAELFLLNGAGMTEEELALWTGRSGGDERPADYYVEAYKEDGRLCFKAKLYLDDGLGDRTEVDFLRLGRRNMAGV